MGTEFIDNNLCKKEFIAKDGIKLDYFQLKKQVATFGKNPDRPTVILVYGLASGPYHFKYQIVGNVLLLQRPQFLPKE